jgi:alanyl-tRNA synthetase
MDAARAAKRDLEQQRVRAVHDDLARRAGERRDPRRHQGARGACRWLASQEARVLADDVRRMLGSGIVILGRAEGDKASILVAVTDDLKARIGRVIS